MKITLLSLSTFDECICIQHAFVCLFVCFVFILFFPTPCEVLKIEAISVFFFLTNFWRFNIRVYVKKAGYFPRSKHLSSKESALFKMLIRI